MKTVMRLPGQKLVMVVLLIIAAIFQWRCTSDDSQGSGGGNALGTVVGSVISDAGVGYVNITVELRTSGGATVASDVTDASGRYEMTGVPVGNYTLQVRAPLKSSVNSNGMAVNIAEGQTATQNFSFEISPVDGFVVLEPRDPMSEIFNENGEIPTGNEPLYTPFTVSNPGAGNPSAILAPDGHHVTLNEWLTASGRALVTCDGAVTNYSLEISGLIPNGVYTLWNAILKIQQNPEDKITFEGSLEALGALKDGNSNSFVASAQGEAQIELSVNTGALSMFGTQPPCALTGTKGFILVVDYHIDGYTYGPTPGPDYLDVAHLLFYF